MLCLSALLNISKHYCVISFSLSLSLYLSVSLSLCLSVSLSLCLSVSLSLCLSVSPSLSHTLSHALSLRLSLSFSLCLSFSLPPLSLHLSTFDPKNRNLVFIKYIMLQTISISSPSNNQLPMNAEIK